MSDDLLQYLEGPMRLSVWWLIAGLALIVGVILWCIGVFVWTLPSARLSRLPLIGSVHAQLVRHRFAHAIRNACERHRSGALSGAEAAASMKRTLRSFLSLQTGSPVQYMHIDDITAATDLAPAAPMFAALDDVQFNTSSRVDLNDIGRDAEELITSWS